MLVKRSFSLSGHRTSVALEPEFWAVLDRLAVMRGMAPAALVASIDRARDAGQPLTSRLRVEALAAAEHTLVSSNGDLPSR